MALSAEEEAEYQQLSSQYDRPGFVDRLGIGSANLATSIPNSIIGGATGLLNMATGGHTVEPVNIPEIFHAPQAKTLGEVGTDIIPGVASAIASIGVPQLAATRGLAALGAAPRLAGIGGAIAGGTWFGAGASPEEAGVQGALGGLQRATDFLPRAARIPLAAVVGVGAGLDAYNQGAPASTAVGIGAANTALAFLPGQERISPEILSGRVPPHPDVIVPDDVYPPERRWRKAKPIKSDTTIEEIPQTITPVHNDFDDNLPIDRRLYDLQLSEEASVTPFTMKDGAIVPTYESKALLPEHAVQEPSAAEAALATLQREDTPVIRSAAEANNAKYDAFDPLTDQHQLTLQDNGTTVYVPKNATAEDVASLLAKKREEYTAPSAIKSDSPEDIDAYLRSVGVEPVATPKKSRAKPLNVEAYTEGNNLRVVPEEGKPGVTVFETLQDVVPKGGKLKFEVPEGTSHAEANKLYKQKKKELVATLQQQVPPTESRVPFQDVPSADISDVELNRMGLDVSSHANISAKPAVARLRKLTGGEHAGTYMDVLAKGLAPVAGGLTGFALDDENRMRGLLLGFMAGGLGQHFGGKAIKAILNMDYGNIGKEFSDVAAQAAFRGRGDTLSKAARFIEHHFGSNVVVNRALSKAQGKASYAADAWDKSLKYLTKKWESMPQNIRDALDDYATVDPVTAPAAFARLQSLVTDPETLSAALLERHTRQNSQVLFAEGLDPNHPMYSKIMDTLGTYQKTAYKIHTHPSYIPTAQSVDDTITELRGIAPSLTDDMAREAVHHYLHDIYVERGMKGIAGRFNAPAKGAESLADVLRKKNPELMGRPAFRAMMGEITEPLQVRAATAMKLIPAIRSGQFFSEMATATTARGNKFALSPEEWDASLTNLRAQIAANPPHIATLQSQLRELENYIRTADDGQLGKLAGKYIHRQVVDRLPSMDGLFAGNSGPMVNSMIALNNHVKQAKVGANPLSWLRAGFGIPFFMAVSRAGGPMNWAGAGREMFKRGRLWKEMMEQGILSGGYGTGEARKDLGIILDPSITEDGVSFLWNKLVHTGAKAMDFADNITRAASYIHNKARFRDDMPNLNEQQLRDAATDWVNDYTMNYSTASKGVRAARQMPFVNQFITYSTEIGRITKNLVRDVIQNRNGNRWYALAALAGIPAIFEGAQLIGEGQLSPEDRAEWKKIKPLLPEYKRHGFLVPTRKKEDGSFEFYNISPLFIADDIARMVKSIASGDLDAVMANNPLIGWDNTPAITVTAAIYGKDMRTGRDLNTTAEKFDAIRKEVLPPLFGGYEMDKFVKALTPNAEGTLGITNEKTGQTFKVSDLLATYYTGIRKENVKLPILVEKAYNVAQARVRAIEGELRSTMMTNATPQDKEHQLDIAKKKIMAIEEDFKRQIQFGE